MNEKYHIFTLSIDYDPIFQNPCFWFSFDLNIQMKYMCNTEGVTNLHLPAFISFPWIWVLDFLFSFHLLLNIAKLIIQEQYIVLHQALLESFKGIHETIPLQSLKTIYQELQGDPKHPPDWLKTQFEVLAYISIITDYWEVILNVYVFFCLLKSV